MAEFAENQRSMILERKNTTLITHSGSEDLSKQLGKGWLSNIAKLGNRLKPHHETIEKLDKIWAKGRTNKSQ